MTFKDLKTGYAVYMLHKDDVRYCQGKVVSVSNPRFQPSGNAGMTFSQTSQQVVDVTIEEDGEQKTYTIPETLDVTYANGLVLSTSRERMQIEVENMKSRAEDILGSVERNKAIVERCTKILTDLNPALKDKQKTEERFNALETKIGSLTDMIEKLVNKI